MMSFITFLLVAHAVVLQSMGQECCGSKTVGDYSYTIAETPDYLPSDLGCKDSCTYTRDDEPGSLYCFADGLEPVNCTAETPVDVCSPGGCPPEADTRVVGVEPTTISERPTLQDCWNYCIALCKENPWCPCHAWNYDNNSGECLTYPYRNCYRTINEPGWTFGKLCFDSNSNTNQSLVSKDVPGKLKNTVGSLQGANAYFTDEPEATSNVSQIIIYTGNYDGRNNVVVGVRFSYGGSPAQLHGRVTNQIKTCNFNISNGEYVRTAKSTAINTPDGRFSMIYSLTVVTNEGVSDCFAGNTVSGQHFTFQNAQFPLHYITGRTTEAQPQMLGSLTFVFYNKTTCPKCS